MLGNLNIRIANLGGTTLGLASGHTIWLDDDAAGHGWFVDATPEEDSEFITPGDQGEQGRMDLLSVLLHEMGHLLGHDHEQDGVMAETLLPGTRLRLVALAEPVELARLLSAPQPEAHSLAEAGPARTANEEPVLIPLPRPVVEEAAPVWQSAEDTEVIDSLFTLPWEEEFTVAR